MSNNIRIIMMITGWAGGWTHISPAMLPVGQLFGDCMTGIKTRNDKVARSFKSITRFI